MARTKTIELNDELKQKLGAWHTAQQQLKQIKEEEFALRQWLVQNAGFNVEKLEGTESLAIGMGWKLVADKTQNYTISNDEGEALAVLNLVGGATGANRPDLAQNLIAWKPQLSAKAYKELLAVIDNLNDEVKTTIKTAIAKALTIKPRAPQLELVPPKEGE